MLEWCDGFDHYGLDEGNLTDGPYAEIDDVSVITLQTAIFRTGTHALRLQDLGGGLSIRRVFSGALEEVGCGGAFYLDQLPNTNGRYVLWGFRDAANVDQLTIIVQSTGAVAAVLGAANGTVIDTSTTLMTADSWNHVEVYVRIHNTLGAVEVRLNGVTIINLAGVDTQATALQETSQCIFNSVPVSSGGTSSSYVDDIFAWNVLGTQNNTFLGDQKVFLVMPDSDVDPQEWGLVGISSGNGCINSPTPDDDASYIEALVPPVSGEIVSVFGLQNLADSVAGISAIYVTPLMRKTDAGVCNVRTSLLSNGVEAGGVIRPLTTAYTYWPDIFELDPNTGAPWTKAAFNLANLRLARTD